VNDKIWFVVLFACIGCFSIAGAVANWNWFMNGPKAAFMVKILGRTGVRSFYALLGAALVAFSVYGYLHPEVMHSRRLGI
jgi:hypothetical protein